MGASALMVPWSHRVVHTHPPAPAPAPAPPAPPAPTRSRTCTRTRTLTRTCTCTCTHANTFVSFHTRTLHVHQHRGITIISFMMCEQRGIGQTETCSRNQCSKGFLSLAVLSRHMRNAAGLCRPPYRQRATDKVSIASKSDIRGST